MTAVLDRGCAPIGLLDSGLGGLSVLQAVRSRLPGEDLLYIADTAYVPYGGRSPAVIRARARALAAVLAGRGVKALVVACNTATAVAVGELREAWPELPVIGMEPAVKPATASTRSGVVGVLATEGTLASARFAALLERHAGRVTVVTRPATGLVGAVEAGDLDGPEVRALLRGHLQPLLDAGADTLILGCTHYPFLLPAIRDLAGPDMTIVETGPAVARELERRLAAAGLLNPGGDGRETFIATGDPARSEAVVARLLGRPALLTALSPAEQALAPPPGVTAGPTAG